MSIQRRHFEQLKAVVPVVLKVLKVVSSESADDKTELKDLFDGALSIANSVHAVCTKLVCEFLKGYNSLLSYSLILLKFYHVLIVF